MNWDHICELLLGTSPITIMLALLLGFFDDIRQTELRKLINNQLHK